MAGEVEEVALILYSRRFSTHQYNCYFPHICHSEYLDGRRSDMRKRSPTMIRLKILEGSLKFALDEGVHKDEAVPGKDEVWESLSFDERMCVMSYRCDAGKAAAARSINKTPVWVAKRQIANPSFRHVMDCIEEWPQAEVSRRVQRDMLARAMVKLYAIMESEDTKPSERLKAVQIISKLAVPSRTKVSLLADWL